MMRSKAVLTIGGVLIMLSMPVPTAAFQCSYNGLRIKPDSQSIPTNPIFVLEAERNHLEQISTISNCDLYLRGTVGKICLTPTRVFDGEVYQTTVVLRPTKPLRPNTKYRIRFSSDFRRLFPFRSRDIREIQKRRWRTNDGPDHSKPKWKTNPEVTRLFKEYVWRGFNNTSFGASILAETEDRATEMVLVSLAHINEPRQKRKHLLPTTKGRVYVGEYLCSSTYDLIQGEEYILTLAPVDLAGNVGKASPKIKFKAPVHEFELVGCVMGRNLIKGENWRLFLHHDAGLEQYSGKQIAFKGYYADHLGFVPYKDRGDWGSDPITCHLRCLGFETSHGYAT